MKLLSFLILLFLQGVSLFWFISGFLLFRHEPELSNTEPFHPPIFQKAVFVIIDALRFDFVVPSSQSEFYLNRFPILHDTATKNPERAFLFRAVADPPTTTLQRLKALTTGCLPTFIDSSSNFGSMNITQDNWIHRSKLMGKKLRFMGDDTWERIYPGMFHPSYPSPSFNVWDLHSVDNDVLKYLYPSFNQSWDILVAHFLGVDHAGHRHGPQHPAMQDKLEQMNREMTRLISLIDENTVLFVLGDHGMDAKGDHGGDSDRELDTTLFMYSKKPFLKHSEAEKASFETFMKKLNESVWNTPALVRDGYRQISQIDLVPTLCYLLGLPIPFGNLGSLIPDIVFYSVPGTLTEKWKNTKTLFTVNARQIHDYLSQYSYLSSGEGHVLNHVESTMNGTAMLDILQHVHLLYSSNREALTTAKSLWAQFNGEYIVLGLFGLILVNIIMVCFALSYSFSKTLMVGLMESLGLSAIVQLVHFLWSTPFPLSWIWAGTMCYLTGIVLYNRGTSLIQRLMKWSWTLSDLVALILVAVHSFGQASDSLTIYEDYTSFFFLQTCHAFIILHVWLFKHSDSQRLIQWSLLSMILGRLSQASTICRQEQHPFCEPTFYGSAQSTISPLWTLFVLPIVYFLVLKMSIPHFVHPKFFIIASITLGSTFIYWSMMTLQELDLLWHELAEFPHMIAMFGFPMYALVQITMILMGKSAFQVFVLLFTALTMVTSPMGSLILSLGVSQIIVLKRLKNSLSLSPLFWTAMVYFLCYHYFFTTGHQTTFTSVQWQMGFVGLKEVSWIWTPLQILGNTFSGFILMTASIPVLLPNAWNALLNLILMHGTHLTITSLFAGIFKRHLMVWSVFAPRFMFGVIQYLVCVILMLLLSMFTL